MIEIGELIRSERQRARMTQEALAEAIGCSKSQLSLMESGGRTISPRRAAQIEAALGVKDGRIVAALQWQSTPPAIREQVAQNEALRDKLLAAMKRDGLDSLHKSGQLAKLVEQLSPSADSPAPSPPGSHIPLINRVSAGYPREFTDLDYPASIADEYVSCPDVSDPNAFAARVVGDSMEPEYREGEIVVFSPIRPTLSGTDCFIRLERDNQTTFKRVYLEDDGRSIRLQPLNPAYPPQVLDREAINGMYAAAYVMRKIGRP